MGGLVLPPWLFSQRDAMRGISAPDPALLLDTIETLPAASGGWVWGGLRPLLR